MLYETKWDPDGITAQRREERVEVSVAHYIIVSLMARVRLQSNIMELFVCLSLILKSIQQFTSQMSYSF